MTNCECKLAGWCQRHNISKTKHLVHLCQTNDDYFSAWEHNIGPGQKSGKYQESRKRIIRRRVNIEKTGRQLWDELFLSVNSLSDLQSWESKIPKYGCDCEKFYKTWKLQNPPDDNISFEWKWQLKTAVNQKLEKPNLSLADAKWLYRFSGKGNPVHFLVTNQDLMKDSGHLAKIIYSRHNNISGIAGVSRSGMLPATSIALTLGVDLYEASPNGLRLLSGGVRRTGTLHGSRRTDNGPIIIVDDSTCSGHAREVLKHLDAPFYTVYAGGEGKLKVDGYAVPLELPHYFEWNLMHNGIIFDKCNAAFDFDGVFCEDCPIEYDDDGEKYINWMTKALPLNWSIEFEIGTIITARREIFRNHTLNWMHRHGIKAKELVMFPGTFEERSRTNIGQWKAEQAKQRSCGVFIESDYHQACEIAKNYSDCDVVSLQKPVIM